MLKSFKSANFDLALSGIPKFAAACLLSALVPLQGHAASALSKQQGLMEQRVPQTESAAPGNSKQDMLDKQRTGAAGVATTVQPSAKSDIRTPANTMKGSKDAGQTKGTGAEMAARRRSADARAEG